MVCLREGCECVCEEFHSCLPFYTITCAGRQVGLNECACVCRRSSKRARRKGFKTCLSGKQGYPSTLLEKRGKYLRHSYAKKKKEHTNDFNEIEKVKWSKLDDFFTAQ